MTEWYVDDRRTPVLSLVVRRSYPDLETLRLRNCSFASVHPTCTSTTVDGRGTNFSMQLGWQRGACATCHYRKGKCDISAVGTPCANCRKSGRDDCQIHQKRRRVGSRPATLPIPIAVTSGLPAHSVPGYQLQHGLDSGIEPTDAQFLTGQPSSTSTALPGVNRQEFRTLLVSFVEQPSLSDRPIDRDARVTYVGTDTSNLNFLTSRRDVDCNVCHHPSNCSQST